MDTAAPDRFEESKQAFIKMLSSEHLDTVPLLILGNKQDLPESRTIMDLKNAFHDSVRRIGNRDCFIKPISALVVVFWDFFRSSSCQNACFNSADSLKFPFL